MEDARSAAGPAPAPERIAVALSGGVDSSVAAALLREQGHTLVGLSLQLQARSACGGADALARAQAVARQLDIPHHTLDRAREFEAEVLRPAWEEYARGRTPNPCLLCNERIKFGLLLAWARRLGADRLATGHYARLARDARGRPRLLRGLDPAKDQSYFLSGLDAGQLDQVRFPLGELRKPEVRRLARDLGLASAEAADSQDACLAEPGRPFAELLRQRFGAAPRPGPVLDSSGALLGQHPGLHLVTIGQRKGLALPAAGRRWVKALRGEDAAVILTADERELYSAGLTVQGLRWLDGELPDGPLACQIQVRYRTAAVPGRLEWTGADAARATFERPVRAVAPGQAAVFFDGERVLGRGWIQDTG
jgi:tRNA-uridine 2-sulfurtransferase